MKATLEQETDVKLTVNIKGLTAMLSCGAATARKIGDSAGARIQVGKRVLYSVKRVEAYLDSIAY